MGAIIILLFVVAAPVLAIALWLVRRSLRKKLLTQVAMTETANTELAALRERLVAAKTSSDELASLRERFKNVLDADSEAARVRAEANRMKEEATAEARRVMDEAAREKSALLAGANQELKAIQETHSTIKKSVDAVLDKARAAGLSFIQAAQQEAEAMTAGIGRKLQDSIDYEKAVDALRNKLEGYGERYLIPPQALLDDLAEDFGYTDAGLALKQAREFTRKLITTNAAATCDYEQDFRRKTAIAFVLDAFNGKIDAIQSRMKNNNVGTLQQEAKDAFATVNANGKAFRDARIVPEFLVARLEEIKWGAAVIALREKAREEQRALKEQMREEERAHREYEKALREALKEEEKAHLALEKVKLAYAQAETESKKQQLEERIREFEKRLAEAKANEEKAISMAQLTKSGHVYVLSNIGSFGEQVLKIGMTRRLDPMDRVRELGDASVPFSFDVHALIYTEDAPELESKLHNKFNIRRVNKVNYRKEFFKASVEEIRDAASELGVQAQFTILAQSLEYKESQAIEQLPKEKQETILAGAVKTPHEMLRQRLLGGDEDADAEPEQDVA